MQDREWDRSAQVGAERRPQMRLADREGETGPPMSCPGCGERPAQIFAGSLPEIPARTETWIAQFEGTSLSVRAALRRVVEHLRSMGVSPETSGDLELALAELMNNIVEHGYPSDVVGEIRLEIDILPSAIVCRLMDRGRALPGGQLPKSRNDPRVGVPRQHLPEGGYGWDLIHALTDLIRYRRCGGCNCLAFVLREARADTG